MKGEEVYRRHEVLGIDVGRCHVTGITAAFACKGRIECDREKTAFRHGLGIQSGALFLDRAKGAGYGDGREPAFHVFRDVHVGCQCDTIAIHKGHLGVIDFFTFGKVLSHSFTRLSSSFLIMVFVSFILFY